MTVNRCKIPDCTGSAFGRAVPRCHRADCPGGTITNAPSPHIHADGRRTASNLVECLMGDVAVIIGTLTPEMRKGLKDRFHATLKTDRRLRARFSKKKARKFAKLE